ncbi:MAG: hypothetical protein ACLUKN_15485 [Bacilli bacterium]
MLGVLSDEAVIMIDQSLVKHPFGFIGKIGMRCPSQFGSRKGYLGFFCQMAKCAQF